MPKVEAKADHELREAEKKGKNCTHIELHAWIIDLRIPKLDDWSSGRIHWIRFFPQKKTPWFFISKKLIAVSVGWQTHQWFTWDCGLPLSGLERQSDAQKKGYRPKSVWCQFRNNLNEIIDWGHSDFIFFGFFLRHEEVPVWGPRINYFECTPNAPRVVFRRRIVFLGAFDFLTIHFTVGPHSHPNRWVFSWLCWCSFVYCAIYNTSAISRLQTQGENLLTRLANEVAVCLLKFGGFKKFVQKYSGVPTLTTLRHWQNAIKSCTNHMWGLWPGVRGLSVSLKICIENHRCFDLLEKAKLKNKKNRLRARSSFALGLAWGSPGGFRGGCERLFAERYYWVARNPANWWNRTDLDINTWMVCRRCEEIWSALLLYFVLSAVMSPKQDLLHIQCTWFKSPQILSLFIFLWHFASFTYKNTLFLRKVLYLWEKPHCCYFLGGGWRRSHGSVRTAGGPWARGNRGRMQAAFTSKWDSIFVLTIVRYRCKPLVGHNQLR